MFLNVELEVTEGHLMGNIQQVTGEIGQESRKKIRS